ncbi:unnamed protein product [Lathyrus oleraceus]
MTYNQIVLAREPSTKLGRRRNDDEGDVESNASQPQLRMKNAEIPLKMEIGLEQI